METKRNITSLIPLITLTWPNQSPNPNFQPFFFYLAMYQKGQRKLDNNSQGKGSPVKGLPSHKRNRSKHKFTATSAPRKSLQRKKKEKLIKRENSYKKKKKKNQSSQTLLRHVITPGPFQKRSERKATAIAHAMTAAKKSYFLLPRTTDWSRFTVSFHTKEEQPLEEAGNTEEKFFFFLPRFFSPIQQRGIHTYTCARVHLCRKALTLFTWIHKEEGQAGVGKSKQRLTPYGGPIESIVRYASTGVEQRRK